MTDRLPGPAVTAVRRVASHPRIAIGALAAALLLGAIAWTIAGGLKARAAADRIVALADQVLVADDGESVDSERIERAIVSLEEARGELSGLDGWLFPYRATAPVIRFIPFRGGDASEAGDLVDYVGAIVDGGMPVLLIAQEAANGGYGASREDIDRLLTFVNGIEQDVNEADAALARAAAKRERIDPARLTEGVRARLETADRLYELIRAGTNLALAAPEALETAEGVIDSGESLVQLTTGSGVGEVITLGARLLEDQRALKAKVDALKELYDSLRPDLDVLQPYLPIDLAVVDEAVGYGIRVLDGFGVLGDSLAAIQTLAKGGFAESPEDAVRLGDELNKIVEQAQALSEDLLTPPGVPGLPEIPERAPELLLDLSAITRYLRDFLGYEGQRVHLVLAQDEEELRSSGGFMGATWMLTTENGRLVERQFASSYEIDGDLGPRYWSSAPVTFTLGLGSRVIPFRDLNWFADFPFAAERLRSTYARIERVRPSTVIAINQSAVARMLAALGPVEVAADGREAAIDVDSSREYLRAGVDPAGAGVPASWDSRRYASYLLGNAVLEALTASQTATAESLAAALTSAARSRDLLISTTIPGASSLFRKLGWDGALTAFNGDGFYVVESNVYAPKISHLMQRMFTYRATVDGDGIATGKLSAAYAHPSPPAEGQCLQAQAASALCYWMVSRIYLPGEAELAAVPPLPVPSGAIASAFQGPEADTTRVFSGADGLPFPVKEIAGLAVVAPGETRTIEAAYSVPGAATQGSDGVWRYDLLVRRQPGLHSATVDVEVNLPPGSCVVGTEPAMAVSGGTVAADFPLERDELLTVWYAADEETCARELAAAGG